MFSHYIEENLELRLPEERDAPEMFLLFERNRIHISKWQDWPNAIQTQEDCREFILCHRREYADGKSLGCVIVFQHKLVGMCDLSKIVPLLRKAHIGYWIAEEYQGRGIVTKSCRALIAHAFTIMKLNRIALQFKHISRDDENTRSRQMAERLGFMEEGVLRQDGMTKGCVMDMVVYSLLAEEWRRIQHEQ